MGAFASFIESEAFFPILILLLMILMFTFVSILMSGKTKEKKRIQERKKIKLDENAQIQLVQDGEINYNKKEIKEEKEIGGKEVVLVKEIEAVELSEVESELDEMRITVEDDSEKEIEIPSFNRPIENMEDEYVVQHQNVFEEDSNESEIVKVELTKPTDISNEDGEEVVIVTQKMENESNGQPIISEEEKQSDIESDAFEMNANEDHTINESVKVEMPKEYDGDKTEILDFPDFDFLDDENSQSIDNQIINQANKYVENIMESRESHEE